METPLALVVKGAISGLIVGLIIVLIALLFHAFNPLGALSILLGGALGGVIGRVLAKGW